MTLHPDIERVALLGWALYPCSSRTRKGCFRGITDKATSDLDQLAEWSHEFPGCNWRVVCGPSGIWGFDLDVPPDHAADGVHNFARLVHKHGTLPERPTARSGGGGLAIFFRHQGERIIGDSGKPAPGIDPRRGRQSQTIPPSVHIRTDKPYRWLVPPWKVAPPVAPAWLVELVRQPEHTFRAPAVASSDQARGRLYKAAGAVIQAPQGTRNETLNRRSYAMARLVVAGLLSEQEAADALFAAGLAAGLDHSEVKATIRSGFAAGFRAGAPVER